MKQPAILWDLDGTIFDTKDNHFKTWEYALNQHGFDLKKETFENILGGTTCDLTLFSGI